MRITICFVLDGMTTYKMWDIVTNIIKWITGTTPGPNTPPTMVLSPNGAKLILEYEGLDQPSEWPGESSGITIGRGYDLGYETDFATDWKPFLLPDEIARLQTAVGLSGAAAEAIAPQFKDIHITEQAADQVFYNKTVPIYIQMTEQAFPGVEALPPDAQGALISLVYNRGDSMGTQGQPSWDSRLEMRNIRALVPKKDLQGIADQIRDMKRLWPDDKGLQDRREAEAQLVESCIQKK